MTIETLNSIANKIEYAGIDELRESLITFDLSLIEYLEFKKDYDKCIRRYNITFDKVTSINLQHYSGIKFTVKLKEGKDDNTNKPTN